MLGPSARRLALTGHVVCSVGWIGSAAAFLALAVAGLTSQDPQTVGAAYIAMDLTARFVIVPLASAALLTGLLQALGTRWGLFRHYWVLIKLVVTAVALVVLLFQLGAISSLSAAARTAQPLGGLRPVTVSLVVHAAVGLLVLLVPAALSVYKPRGLTRYGRRKQLRAAATSRP